MVDVIQTPIETPVAGEPGVKPDISHTLTQEKEATAARQERRRERMADVAIETKDIKKLTRKRQDDGPVAVDFSDDARPDGSMPLRTAQRAYAKMKNVERGHELAKEIGYKNPIPDDHAREMSEYVTQLGRSASEAKKDHIGLVRHNGEQLTPIPEGWSAKEHMRAEGEEKMTPERATEYMRNYRIAAAEADARLKAEIAEGIQQQEAAEAWPEGCRASIRRFDRPGVHHRVLVTLCALRT